ncbi:hypothetical protein ACU610_03500 [Geodermatophilus sp. URMC 61]|uniref:hypothetical protein n=1 Tax=Geodermatophilus sp. URMC 61 TaxID=3423411 RepID=UPI00406C660E
MRVETDEAEIIERVAVLDVGKAEVVCCARVPGPGGRRMQEVRTVSTMTPRCWRWATGWPASG